MSVVGLVLAAGRSSRFGSEKAMALLDGRPLLDHAIDYLGDSCVSVAVSAAEGSQAADHASGLGLTVLSDRPSDPKGPLAGLNAGLQWAKGLKAELLLLTPCDTPRIPRTVAEALVATKQTAVARTASGLQPLHSIWRVEPALDAITVCFQAGRHPAVRELLGILEVSEVAFTDEAAFLNMNTAEDLALLAAETPTFDTQL